LAAPTPEAWDRLKRLIGFSDPAFDDRDYRLAHRGPVDAAITEFCRNRSREELEELGRSNDVAITRVFDVADLARDAHFREREMFVEWDDPVAGRVKGAGIAPKFSDTPGRVWRGAPWLGQDNHRVLGEMLGLSDAEITALRSRDVVGERPPTGPPSTRPPFFVREGL